MRYKLLGRTGVRISELCLGTMTFGEEWGWGSNKEESRRVFDDFVKAGGNFLDTANMYTNGTSEKMLGEFLGPERDQFILATKYSFPLRDNDPNSGGNHRKSARLSVERSLQSLKTDYIDLLWVHAWDFFSSVEEVMRGLDDLVRTGKVLYIGISDAPAWIVAQANTLAALKNLSSFVALQVEYSLVERGPERDLLPMARALGLTVTPWSPLGGGVLTGKYNNGSDVKEARLTTAWSERKSPRHLGIAAVGVAIAKEIGRSPSQVALAWLRAQGPDVVPIIGARKEAQFKDNLACLDLTLSPEHLRKLDEASHIELGFPHDFLSNPDIRNRLAAGLYDQIDKERSPARN